MKGCVVNGVRPLKAKKGGGDEIFVDYCVAVGASAADWLWI